MSDPLDRIIDDALCTYSAHEPRIGLERRILNQIAQARPARRFAWWPLGTAVAGACAVMTVAFYLPARLIESALPPPALVRAETARLEPPVPIIPSVRAVRVSSQRPAPRPLSKQEQFPAPVPLTPEEIALLRFAGRYPNQTLASEQPSPINALAPPPIVIPEIEIKPLDNGTD